MGNEPDRLPFAPGTGTADYKQKGQQQQQADENKETCFDFALSIFHIPPPRFGCAIGIMNLLVFQQQIDIGIRIDFFIIRPTLEELSDPGVLTVGKFFAGADEAKNAAIQQGDPISDKKNRGKFVRDHDDAHLEGGFEFKNKMIDADGDYWIQTGGRLVAEQNFRIHGQCSGQGGAFAHAAGQLGRQMVEKSGKPHQFQFHAGHDLDGRGIQRRVFTQRQSHIFADCHGIEQSAALKEDAHFFHQLRPPRLIGVQEVHVFNRDGAAGWFFQAHQVAQQSALAAA